MFKERFTKWTSKGLIVAVVDDDDDDDNSYLLQLGFYPVALVGSLVQK